MKNLIDQIRETQIKTRTIRAIVLKKGEQTENNIKKSNELLKNMGYEKAK